MGAVKPAPRATLRAERAQVTRRRIADAARTLFAGKGYGATTLREVAQEAGVAVQTVYAVFGSKAGILRELREAVVVEPEAAALFGRALAGADRRRAVRLFAASIRRRWEAGHDVVVANEDAAATEPAIRAEVDAVLTRRRGGIARLADAVGSMPGPTLDTARVAALFDALSLPEVYRELVVVQGWTPDDYEDWLARTLEEQLELALEGSARPDR